MTEYLNAMPAVWEKIDTKKELKEKCTPTTEFYIYSFLSANQREGYVTLKDLPEGTELTVTNHPKRTWFANVSMRDGKVRIK